MVKDTEVEEEVCIDLQDQDLGAQEPVELFVFGTAFQVPLHFEQAITWEMVAL